MFKVLVAAIAVIVTVLTALSALLGLGYGIIVFVNVVLS